MRGIRGRYRCTAFLADGFDPGGADGLFGPRTRAAIRSWQSARGARSTGYLDGSQVEALRGRSESPPPAAVGAVVTDSGGLEVIFWQSIVNSTNPADFEAYLRRFPNGVFSELAQNRLGALRRAAGGQIERDQRLPHAGTPIQHGDASLRYPPRPQPGHGLRAHLAQSCRHRTGEPRGGLYQGCQVALRVRVQVRGYVLHRARQVDHADIQSGCVARAGDGMSIRTALRVVVGNDRDLLHAGVLELLDVRCIPIVEPAGAAGRKHAIFESGPQPVDVLLALHHDDRPPLPQGTGLAQGLQAIERRLDARHVEGPPTAAVAPALPEVLQTDADHLVGFVVAITNDLVRLQLRHGDPDGRRSPRACTRRGTPGASAPRPRAR